MVASLPSNLIIDMCLKNVDVNRLRKKRTRQKASLLHLPYHGKDQVRRKLGWTREHRSASSFPQKEITAASHKPIPLFLLVPD